MRLGQYIRLPRTGRKQNQQRRDQDRGGDTREVLEQAVAKFDVLIARFINAGVGGHQITFQVPARRGIVVVFVRHSVIRVQAQSHALRANQRDQHGHRKKQARACVTAKTFKHTQQYMVPMHGNSMFVAESAHASTGRVRLRTVVDARLGRAVRKRTLPFIGAMLDIPIS